MFNILENVKIKSCILWQLRNNLAEAKKKQKWFMMLFWLNKVQLCIPKKLCMMISSTFADPELYNAVSHIHGLRTPNEGINQRNLKIWADVADKISFGRT